MRIHTSFMSEPMMKPVKNGSRALLAVHRAPGGQDNDHTAEPRRMVDGRKRGLDLRFQLGSALVDSIQDTDAEISTYA